MCTGLNDPLKIPVFGFCLFRDSFHSLFRNSLITFSVSSLCRLQIIIDDDTIKLGSKSHFVFRLCDAAFDYFGLIRAPTRQPTAEFFDGGRLYKDGQCTLTVILFDVASAYYIQVEYYVLSAPSPTAFPLVLSAFRNTGSLYTSSYSKTRCSQCDNGTLRE